MGCCGKKNNKQRASSSLPVIGQSKNIVSSKGRYVSQRMKICAKCEHNKNGICEKISENSNDYRATILNGIQRKSLSCPVGKWSSIHAECMGCGRVAKIDERTNRCKQCIQKRQTSTGKTPLGKDSIRHLSFYFSCDTENAILYHLERIDREIETFNGKKVCYFHTPDENLKNKYIPEIRKRFDKISKGGSISILMSDFKDCSKKDIVCFANTVKISENTEVNNLLTGVLYDTVFHNWQEAELAMKNGASCVGSFKNASNNKYRWCFWGGFFWVRSSHIFNGPKWIRGATTDFSRYLGCHIEDSSSHCMFGDWYDISSKQEDEIIQDISLDFKKWNNNSRTN